MIYPIESRSDLAGATLVIRFPETDLDIKALYTIQADPPDFLIPFRYRCVNGEAECTYQLGSRNKLLYRCSSKTPAELTGFWESVLQPLLDCSDWFLKPFSFVLNSQYLYTDKEAKMIFYLYIPAKTDSSSFDDFQKMVVELAQKNPATDAKLEVKVLRAIMQDFQPKTFLQLLRESLPSSLAQSLVMPQTPVSAPASPKPDFPILKEEKIPISEPENPELIGTPESSDIKIDLSGSKKNKKEKKGLFGHKDGKKKKESGLFGRKKETPKELLLGAAAEPPAPKRIASGSAVVLQHGEDMDNMTTLLENTAVMTACFRLVGDSKLPREIPVSLDPGGIFTIGRFDVSIGIRQSDFEFEAKTKAVSRHHAAVERMTDGSYTLVDLGSSAGTFVDGERLIPNVPRRLSCSSRISFGNAGADYVWEE